jgi:hypothetical protein
MWWRHEYRPDDAALLHARGPWLDARALGARTITLSGITLRAWLVGYVSGRRPAPPSSPPVSAVLGIPHALWHEQLSGWWVRTEWSIAWFLIACPLPPASSPSGIAAMTATLGQGGELTDNA